MPRKKKMMKIHQKLHSLNPKKHQKKRTNPNYPRMVQKRKVNKLAMPLKVRKMLRPTPMRAQKPMKDFKVKRKASAKKTRKKPKPRMRLLILKKKTQKTWLKEMTKKKKRSKKLKVKQQH
jgi:hypothetical protein